MTKKSSLAIQVPQWGDVFINHHISEHNRQSLEEEYNSRARTLTRKEKKRLERKKNAIIKKLKRANYNQLVERYQSIKSQHAQLPKEPQYRGRAGELKKEAQSIQITLYGLRDDVMELRQIKNRLKEHDQALRIEAQEREDWKVMRREADHFAGKLIERYSQLKYRELVYRDGKEYRYKVRFECVYILPHMHVFKIDVSRLTLLGANRNNLPEGVRVVDLTNPDTCKELSAAAQRNVWSPHNRSEDGGLSFPFKNGAFICVDRPTVNSNMPDYVELGDVLEYYRMSDNHRYPMPMGITSSKKIHWAYLDNTPHVMINGLTGTGKTTAIIGIIATLIQKHSPDDLRLLITDMKQGGDFRAFSKVPHNLADGILFTPADLQAQLEKVVAMLHHRQRQIGQAQCRDIKDYNLRHDEKLPRVVVVIDEYSQTKDFDNPDVKKRIDYCTNVIARLGRAAGIHLILGNQQPYTQNLPSEVKGNVTLQLTGYQITLGASISAVGSKRANTIENKPGRMLLNDGLRMLDVQVPYATEMDVHRAVVLAMEWERPQLDDEDTQPIITIKSQLTKEDVIEIAINEFDGILAVKKIWAQYQDITSRPHMEKLVKQIVTDGEIAYGDDIYTTAKYKAGYRLVPKIQRENGGDGVEHSMEQHETLEQSENEVTNA